MSLSGDGFVTLPDGSRRWGRFGAAGVLARWCPAGGEPQYFLALRSTWTHQGGTWAVPGGALDEGESPLDGALREFAEEIGTTIDRFEVVEMHEDDHGGWSYTTVVVDVPERFAPSLMNWETADARWVPASELAGLELMGPFRETLSRLGLL